MGGLVWDVVRYPVLGTFEDPTLNTLLLCIPGAQAAGGGVSDIPFGRQDSDASTHNCLRDGNPILVCSCMDVSVGWVGVGCHPLPGVGDSRGPDP